MEPTKSQRGELRRDVVDAIAGSLIGVCLGLLVILAIMAAVGCGVRGYQTDDETFARSVNANGHLLYDNTGHNVWIGGNGQGNTPNGPVRVYTDHTGHRRMIDSQGQTHQIYGGQ